MKHISQITVPYGIPYSVADVAENMKLSLEALGHLVTSINAGPYGDSCNPGPLHAIAEYVTYP
jgi:hypothetical protein